MYVSGKAKQSRVGCVEVGMFCLLVEIACKQ